MGFDVVRRVVEDLRSSRLRFGDLAVRWRGEPLLHPEAMPILQYILDAISSGAVAQRLVVETDGRFLTEELAALSALPGAQVWILDGDRSSPEVLHDARRRLVQYRHRGVQVLTAYTAHVELDSKVWESAERPVRVGERPHDRDAIWIRRSSHNHYRADQAATSALLDIAESLKLPTPHVRDNRPTSVAKAPLSPTISWDGKVTLNPTDRLLDHPVGDVVHSSLSAAWAAIG